MFGRLVLEMYAEIAASTKIIECRNMHRKRVES